MRKNACLFPFNESTLLMLKHKELIRDYSIKYTGALSGHINGFMNDIKDCNVEYIDVWNDEVCNQFDTVIVPGNYIDTQYNDVKNRLCTLKRQGKEIVQLAEANMYANSNIIEKMKISPISACVILIAGLGSHIQKNETAIDLYNRFNSDGIHAEIVSSCIGSSIMGFYEFPKFMYDSNIDEYNKMFEFNNFIKNIDSTNPDVIIICAPGNIMPYPDDTEITNCGILHFMISSVVPPDYICCNLYAKEYSEYELKDIIETCEKRIGKSIDGFVMSDFAIDWIAYNDILRDVTVQVFPLSSDIVDRYVQKLDANTKDINVHSMRHIDDLYINIMKTFCAYERNFQIL